MSKIQHALLPGRISRLRPVPATTRLTPPLSRTLWYALYFPALDDSAAAGQHNIEQLASLCQQVSDHIAIAGGDTLALEIRSSLKYFGGIRRLRSTLHQSLHPALSHQFAGGQFPTQYYDAASPSASASIVLARAQRRQLVTSVEDLRSALGNVAIAGLALDKKLVYRLQQCGLLYLRDIWRLPSATLRIRFGRTLCDYLEELLALRPSRLERWQPAPSFCETLTPDLPAENQRDVLLLADHLLANMQQFLQKHHLTTDHLSFRLDDISGNTHHIDLGMRRPVRDKDTWLLLLTTRLQALATGSSVSAVTLSVHALHAYQPGGANPHNRNKSGTSTAQQGLLEILCARLGEEGICRLHQQADHDPAAAGEYVPYRHNQKMALGDTQQAVRGFGLHAQQPCLLLSTPLALSVRNTMPVYLSPLTFLCGPERLETHWWSGKNIRRDYYIAANQQGMMLWVYRDIKQRLWFLQGLFA